ncbi:MAG: UDP-N-acetylglucosamine 2-epimerase (non-hydrolyzing) [Gemmatimonadota bacterium]|nr:MAG: UDP-N-acetylglucosamine 2-epimerase (non-hydrolyzing) [Gemmatimonadota bacterium]
MGEPAGGHRRRVLVVVGTRPEAIKMAPVLDALRRDGRVDSCLALTGQHTDLVDQVLNTFGMVPEYDLGIMREGQTLYDVAHACLDGLREVVNDYCPEVLLVQGDTATVFFGSLVSYFEDVRVGHVEAGLRTKDKRAPFPEEMFRHCCDVIADYRFAPTQRARENLLAEGVSADTIHLTGNTVVDALRCVAEQRRPVRDPTLAEVIAGDRRLVLLTAHRRESFGEPLRNVFRAVLQIADAHADIEIVYPVHPNPDVLEPAHEILSGHERVHLIDPLDYADLVAALRHSRLILTDSGGIQEEAPTFGTPVLVLRKVTERPEGLDAGVACLVGTEPGRIVSEAERLLAAERMTGEVSSPYGDGRAGERIADILISEMLSVARSTTDWESP